MRSVLFVCSANICRSPMAMALLRSMVKTQPDEWLIESAGVWALMDYPAASIAQEIMKEKDMDLSFHRSRPVTLNLVEKFQLILTMEKNQKEALQIAFPQFDNRIFMVSEMIGRIFDIADPIGKRKADYELTVRELDEILGDGFPMILDLSVADKYY